MTEYEEFRSLMFEKRNTVSFEEYADFLKEKTMEYVASNKLNIISDYLREIPEDSEKLVERFKKKEVEIKRFSLEERKAEFDLIESDLISYKNSHSIEEYIDYVSDKMVDHEDQVMRYILRHHDHDYPTEEEKDIRRSIITSCRIKRMKKIRDKI